MIRAWKHILRPLAEAIDAKSILEIGSEFGTSTQVLLNYLRKTGGHLYAIDPYPDFDVAQFEREYEGLLTFHQQASLHALRQIPMVDLALVDGDHNWYTVYHELKLLEESHGADPLKLPLTAIHDTGWPYGRRDLYYRPEAVPEEYRHPWAREGVAMGKRGLVGASGMNQTMCNAREEGGPRNGVLTAVEDYLEQSDVSWEMLQIPLYFGITILATRQRLDSTPALAERFADLEHQLQGSGLIAFGEQLRLAEGTQFQNVYLELQAAKQRIAELEEKLAGITADGRALSGSV
jgi:hypothetical protein